MTHLVAPDPQFKKLWLREDRISTECTGLLGHLTQASFKTCGVLLQITSEAWVALRAAWPGRVPEPVSLLRFFHHHLQWAELPPAANTCKLRGWGQGITQIPSNLVLAQDCFKLKLSHTSNLYIVNEGKKDRFCQILN